MNDDKKLIESIVPKEQIIQQRPVNDFQAMLNSIIFYCEIHNRQASKKEIQDYLKVQLDTNFVKYVNESQKLKYNDKKELFELKSIYDIKNIEELKSLIKEKRELGLLEDHQLKTAYKGIEKDLDFLKNEKFVKIIFNHEKKLNVLFYRDMNDIIEKKIVEPNFKDALKELRETWKELDNSIDYGNSNSYLNKKKIFDKFNDNKIQSQNDNNNNINLSKKKRKGK